MYNNQQGDLSSTICSFASHMLRHKTIDPGLLERYTYITAYDLQ